MSAMPQQTRFHAAYRIVRRILPGPLARGLRRTVTAFAGPFWQAQRLGFMRSAFAGRAMDRNGAPLPWYTYSSIAFLDQMDFSDRSVLEFGGGQSTLWWAARAASVTTIESDPEWFAMLRDIVPGNVTLCNAKADTTDAYLAIVRRLFEEWGGRHFDIIAIDGRARRALVPLALAALGEGGAVLYDNSEQRGAWASLKDSGLQRTDFFGAAPGVFLPQATSIFFRPGCFLFDNRRPILAPTP